MKKHFHLTQDGVEQLKKELSELVGQRAQVADRIKQARELGDLSENAEYQTAREEQDRLEVRIGELEHVLQNLQIIKKPKSDGKVRLGSKIKLQATRGKSQQEFQIVGTLEADPLNGKISDESPIGKALMGKKVGERVEIKTNSHTTAFNVLKVG
jgi:transcription elongation factor GreA